MGFQPSGVKEFVKLDDTPAAFTGHGTKSVKVNAGATALEFQAESGITGVKVRKNYQMPIIGTRPQLNLVEGAAIDISILDNPPDDEIDIIIGSKVPTRFMTLFPDDAILPTTNPAAKAKIDGTNFSYDVLDFDQATEESCFWERFLTPDYDAENIVLDIYWIATPAAGDVKFGFSVLGREKGETWDAALGTERTVVQPTGGAGVLNKARITTFSPGWSPGDVLLFKLARKAADAADTLAADARVVKVVVSYTGQFAQSFYPLPEPVELTKPGALAWGDIDVSAYAPPGATGVILHVVNQTVGGVAFGLRKKGSTDDRTAHFVSDHLWAAIGIDESRIFQTYYANNGDFHIYLVAYTATGVNFFDNAYDKSLGVTAAWTDIDCSAECPGAIGIIIEVHNTTGVARLYNVRKKGSTDGRYSTFPQCSIDANRIAWAIIGCDASQVFQGIISDVGVDFYVVGYVTAGAVFKTNADDISLTEAEVWKEINLSAEAPSGIMAFVEINPSSAFYDNGLRKNGSTEDICSETNQQFAMVPCDSGQIIEGKVTGPPISVYFFLIGYAQWAGA